MKKCLNSFVKCGHIDKLSIGKKLCRNTFHLLPVSFRKNNLHGSLIRGTFDLGKNAPYRKNHSLE